MGRGWIVVVWSIHFFFEFVQDPLHMGFFHMGMLGPNLLSGSCQYTELLNTAYALLILLLGHVFEKHERSR